MKNTKLIILTGGVYSSLGKGIIASSIGSLLDQLGFNVSILKFDPYLNINPAQLSPLQHGEVFVTADGCQTDLDIGNYERFIGKNLNKFSSVCSGKIYKEIIDNQLKDFYNGQTVQVIPHVTDLIIDKIEQNIYNNKPDFLIVEIGGTVGDIESIPFFEAIKRYEYKIGKQNILYAHCIPLITISNNEFEIKTKPAQHSIQRIRSLGLSPDILFVRSKIGLTSELNKISELVLINNKNIYNVFDLDSTYFLVNELFEQKVHLNILNYFNINEIPKNNIDNWLLFTNSITNNKLIENETKIMIIGEYTILKDAYFSVIESLKLASYKFNIKIKIDFFDFEKNTINDLKEYDGIINGGFKDQKFENKKLFDFCIKNNLNIISYNYGFINLIDYLIKDKNKYEQFVFYGEKQSTIINKKIIDEWSIDFFNERKYNDFWLKKTFKSDLKEKDFEVLSIVDNKYIDSVVHKNHKIFAYNFNPEFTSKPNNINKIYEQFLKLCRK